MAPDIYAPLVYRPTLIAYNTAPDETYVVHNTCVFGPDFIYFYLFIYLLIYLFTRVQVRMCAYNAPETDTRLLNIYSSCDLDFGVSCKFFPKNSSLHKCVLAQFAPFDVMREPYIEVSPFACHMYSV